MNLAVLRYFDISRIWIGEKFLVGVAHFFSDGELRQMNLAVLRYFDVSRIWIGEKFLVGVAHFSRGRAFWSDIAARR